MSRGLRACFLVCAAISIASAALFALLRYSLEPSDDFAAYNHPAQPHALTVHVASSIALTFVLGVLFHAHVLPRLALDKRARRSGLLLCALAALMTASGAILPSVAASPVHQFLWILHLLTGSGFALALPCHVRIALRGARLSAREAQALARLRQRDERAPLLQGRFHAVPSRSRKNF